MNTVFYVTDRTELSVLILQIMDYLSNGFGGFLPALSVPELQPIRVVGTRPYFAMKE